MNGTPDALPRTRQAIERGIIEGLHVGAQLYVSQGGRVMADAAFGAARPGDGPGSPAVPMRPDTLILWLSATKPAAAVAVAQLWERGLLDLDDPVARHLPEFAAKGKGAVTLRHVLTHTGGFRGIAGDWEDGAWDEILRRVCDARLEPGWVPGRKAGYHVSTSWYVLGEIVRRLDGRPFDRYVREMIFQPLGMHDSWVGLPPQRYRAYGERVGLMHDTQGSAPRADNPNDTEAGAAACRPASNGRGPARELGMFYEMLLGKGARAGVRVLSPQAAEALSAIHRVGMYDHTFRHVIDWGLGVIVNSARYGPDTVPYGYGPHASPRAFGHGGSQSCSAFADPEHGLAVAVVCNGRPGEAKHDRRMRVIHAAIYEDLGLTAVTTEK